MSEDWTTKAARWIIEAHNGPDGLGCEPISADDVQIFATIIRTTHETEGREDCTRRVVEREEKYNAPRDVGVQDQARDHLLARVAGNVASGIVSGALGRNGDGWDAIRPGHGLESTVQSAVDVAEAILKCIEEKKS